MADDLTLLAEALAPTTRKFVQVASEGFRIGETTYTALRATIASWTLGRKLFHDRRLICRSNDGEMSTEDKCCLDCPDRPFCTPRVRLSLTKTTGTPPGAPPTLGRGDRLGDLVLELPPTSGRNFLAHARPLAYAHVQISDVPVRLTILQHDSWREVCFTADPDPAPETA